MNPVPAARWRRRLAGAAFLAIAAIAPGCGRPPDEAWLRFVGFKQGDKAVGVFTDNLYGAAAATVDADFENQSQNLGKTDGTGILVYRATIDYRMSGASPPSADIPLNLYLPPRTAAATSASPGKISGFPLAPTSLKNWVIGHAAGPAVVELTARVTFFAETDQGAGIETQGNIKIELSDK
jgi:hypothetical protein